MGTQYTYNNDTVTSGATINDLTGKTIAYYGYVDEDPYLRVLSCNAAGTLQDITIGSGGSLVIFRAKTVVSNLTVSGNSANTSISMSSGGQVISGLTVRGHGAKITLGGVKVYDVDIRPTNRVTLSNSWNAAVIDGGYIESTTLGMGNGTIKNVTIGPSTYVNLTGSKGTDLNLGAKFISGSAVSGAQIRIWSSGGSVVSTTFDNARLYMYGGQTEGVLYRGRAKDLIFENKAYFENGGISTAVVSGVTSSYNFSGGTATNLIFRTSAYAHVRNQGYISGAVVSGQSTRIVVSGGGLIEDITFRNSGYAVLFSGGSLNKADASEKDARIIVSGGALATSITLDSKAFMNVHSGAVANSITIGSGASVAILAGSGTTALSGGTATDITVRSGGSLVFSGGAWQALSRNPLASRVTIESGGTVALINYARLMDVTAGSGAKIKRESNITGIGGKNTNIAKGVFTNPPGADFEVVDGVATGLYLNGTNTWRGFCIYSGLTATNVELISGGSLYAFEGAEVDGAEVDGSATSGSYLWISGGVGRNIRIGSGARTNIGAGTLIDSLTVTSSGLINLAGGTVNDLNMVSGGSLSMTGGTVSGLSMTYSGGSVSMTAGTVDGLVMSGGTMWTVQNANKKYIYNIDVTNDNNGVARTGNADIGILNISSGTYVSGGSMHDRAQLNLRYGVVEDVYFGANTWNNLYWSATISGGTAGNGADFRMGYGNADMLIDGMLFQGNAKVHLRDSRATVKNVVMSGNQNCQIDVSAGVVSSATLWNGNITLSGGSVVSSGADIILGKGIASDTLIRSAGKILQSGGTMTNTGIYTGGKNLYIYDDFDNDGQTVVSNLTMVGVGSAGSDTSSGCAWGYMYGGLISGGELRRALLAINGGTVEKVNFGADTWINTYNDNPCVLSNCTASNGAVIRGRSGATITGLTMTDSGTALQFSGGVVTDITLRNGASMYVSGGAVLTSAMVSNGGIIRLYNGAAATSVGLESGGTMYLSGLAKITGITAAAGALISLDLSGKTAGSANFDSLANVNSLTIQNYNPGNGTYTLADAGNTGLKVGIVGSRVFDGEVAAGGNWVNPLIAKQFTLNAAGTELTVAAYTRTSTGEAATFATSGAEINGGDKELQWEVASIANPVTLIEAATTVEKNAWLDIHTCTAETGATIFGVAQNVDFAGKVSYQLHGGNKLANVAFGANYGGTVGGVEILSYNTTYTGVGYAGGFGTVGNDGIELVFASNCVLNKDFYAGALANYARTSSTTSVSSIRTSFGESAGQVAPTVKGNFYGGGAVKAGTITTTENTSALQTVGDITLTLLAGTATKSDVCVFAGGYATGHDTAKEAPVYTVESVTLSVGGGDWGTAAGGRGIFGGAMASDNIGNDGVYAMVGDVNISISGGTMGNVYGGGWAQKKAFSRVGDVYITISGGTIANIFGGGSHSTSGGTTQADNVTITVSGGTINGDIYARGQLDGDVVNSAEVIFTGANDFACGVYGYSYVGEAPASDAALTFSDYTGTISGKIGGFADITVGGNSWMTLGSAADDVANGAWIFDFDERVLGLDGQAALTWSTADFTEDTITLRIATTRSEGWTLVSGADASKYNTAADKFRVEIDGGDAVSLTFDAATGKTGTIADGDYAGWGFAVENSVLKFKKLA